jgi:hypothetical protein
MADRAIIEIRQTNKMGAEAPQGFEPENQPDATNVQGSINTKQIKTAISTSIITQSAKQAFDSTVSTIGERTGDYQRQNRISNGLKVGGILYGAVKLPLVAIPALTISLVEEQSRIARDNRRAVFEADNYALTRGGLTTSNLRNRGRYL